VLLLLPLRVPEGGCLASGLEPSLPMSADQTRTPLYGERAIAEAELICFDNPRPGRAYEVSITLQIGRAHV